MKSLLNVVLIIHLFLLVLVAVCIFSKSRNIAKVFLVNAIASQVVVLLVLLAFLMQEDSLIDMSFIYVLLSPLGSMCVLLYRRCVYDRSDTDTEIAASSVAKHSRDVVTNLRALGKKGK